MNLATNGKKYITSAKINPPVTCVYHVSNANWSFALFCGRIRPEIMPDKDDTSMPLENQVLNNRYKLLAQVAAGGMALVYKAQDTMLNRIVAVKILRESFAEDPAFQKRFVREAQSAANLTHPNIVTIYDFGRDGDRQYIVMEYVEGRDLKSIIRAEGPLPLARSLDIARQVCEGVGAAHRLGVVHCDVKPQNVLITADGRAKVTDFGIARAFSAAAPVGYTESV